MHCMRSWMCSLSTTTSCLVYCQSSSMISSSGVSNKVRHSLLVGAENAGLEFDNIKPCCHCHVFEAIFRMPQPTAWQMLHASCRINVQNYVCIKVFYDNEGYSSTVLVRCQSHARHTHTDAFHVASEVSNDDDEP